MLARRHRRPSLPLAKRAAGRGRGGGRHTTCVSHLRCDFAWLSETRTLHLLKPLSPTPPRHAQVRVGGRGEESARRRIPARQINSARPSRYKTGGATHGTLTPAAKHWPPKRICLAPANLSKWMHRYAKRVSPKTFLRPSGLGLPLFLGAGDDPDQRSRRHDSVDGMGAAGDGADTGAPYALGSRLQIRQLPSFARRIGHDLERCPAAQPGNHDRNALLRYFGFSVRTERNGTLRSTSCSFGMPRTRSEMMLRWI
jgi:hypothetical protein